MQRQITGFRLTLAVGAALSVASCDADPADELAEPAETDIAVVEHDVTTAPLATTSGWTDFTSDEGPPIGCDGSSMVSGFGCSGTYCDNVRLYCSHSGELGYGSYWSSYFSEETGEDNNFRRCKDRYWMVGVVCSGSYCDKLSIQCRYFPSASPHGCYWTGWVSEESGGTLYFAAGYHALGMRCSGSYCDNKRFYVCRP